MSYIGRFAPSPTGKLHFGSLVSALASFLDARHNNGKWLVRIEDMDPPREERGAASAILKCLESYHLHWDGELLFQSTNHHRYRYYLNQLDNMNLLFNCDCTRSRLKSINTVYDGNCRELNLLSNPEKPLATRLLLNNAVEWDDLIQGRQHFDYDTIGGDFIVIRRDQLISYQIAVSVDDYEQGITHVVRGADLLSSTARQLYLMQCLKLPTPVYAHVPMATHSNGDKLSKQTAAAELELDTRSICTNLYNALIFLGQHPPSSLINEAPSSILSWAVKHWKFQQIPQQLSQFAL